MPTFVLRLRILDLTFDHEAPCFSNMRRRPSRKDSDLNGVVDVRYTGGARMLLMLEVGGGQWRLQVGHKGYWPNSSHTHYITSAVDHHVIEEKKLSVKYWYSFCVILARVSSR